MDSKNLLNELLVELFNHILSLEEQNLQSKGIKLSMNEIHTIEAIRDLGQPRMSEVAAKLLVTLGTMTTGIKRLEAKGYVVRYKKAGDARFVNVKLLQIAYDALKIHDEFHQNMIDTVLEELDSNEEQVLMGALHKVKNYFNNHYEYLDI